MIKMRIFSILCVVLLIAGCSEGEDDIGLQLQSDNLLNSTLIDTFSVEAYTTLEYNTLTSEGTSSLLVGTYENSETGRVKVSSYTQILPPNQNVGFGTNPEVDSVRLRLYYATDIRNSEEFPRVFGDITQPMPFDVYEITEDFASDRTYTAEDELATGQLLGSTPGDFTPSSSGESAVNITLPNSFGESILEHATGDFSSFIDQIKGISLQPSTDQPGAVIGFADSSKVDVFYHNDEKTDGIRLSLNIIEKRFNRFEADRSGTPLQALTEKGDRISSEETDHKTYIQSGTGIRTLLEFPTMSDFFADKGDVIIDKAELIIPADRSHVQTFANEPPTDLIGFQTNAEGGIKVGENGAGTTVPSEPYLINQIQQNVFLYDFDKDAYVMDITTYIQNVSLGKTPNNPIILTSGFDGVTANYGVLFDQLNEDNPIQFKVYYTQ